MLLILNKPYGVLSSFTGDTSGKLTLSKFGFPPRVYPVGRLDADSEGLLLLCDEAGFNHRLLDPDRRHWRKYWTQVEGLAQQEQVAKLVNGVLVQDRMTLPAKARIIHPTVPPRDPPIRQRKSIPTSWIELELREGRNRQVRRMTAAVGLPTLRLMRVAIGEYSLPPGLQPGDWEEVSEEDRKKILSTS